MLVLMPDDRGGGCQLRRHCLLGNDGGALGALDGSFVRKGSGNLQSNPALWTRKQSGSHGWLSGAKSVAPTFNDRRGSRRRQQDLSATPGLLAPAGGVRPAVVLPFQWRPCDFSG